MLRSPMDEGRKRVLLIAVSILAALYLVNRGSRLSSFGGWHCECHSGRGAHWWLAKLVPDRLTLPFNRTLLLGRKSVSKCTHARSSTLSLPLALLSGSSCIRKRLALRQSRFWAYTLGVQLNRTNSLDVSLRNLNENCAASP